MENLKIKYQEKEIKVDKISPFITRERDRKGFEELKESIKKYELINPITVMAKSDGTYLLVKGEGRVLAHKELGFDNIKAFVFEEDAMDMKEVILEWLVENKVREKMTPQDKAQLINLKLKQGGKIKDVAKKYDLRPSTAKQYAKTIEESGDKLMDMIDKKKLSFTHVKEILAAIKKPENREVVAEFVSEEKLPIKDTRTIVKIAKITEEKIKRTLSITDIRDALKAIRTEKHTYKQLFLRNMKRKERLHGILKMLLANIGFEKLLQENGIQNLKEA